MGCIVMILVLEVRKNSCRLNIGLYKYENWIEGLENKVRKLFRKLDKKMKKCLRNVEDKRLRDLWYECS